jgi:hypothetical protein
LAYLLIFFCEKKQIKVKKEKMLSNKTIHDFLFIMDKVFLLKMYVRIKNTCSNHIKYT